MGDRSSTKSWPPTGGGITWTQLGALLTVVSLVAGAAWYVPSAIAEEGAAARRAARELVESERETARREFATRADVLVLQSELRAAREQLAEVLAILRERDGDGRRRRD